MSSEKTETFSSAYQNLKNIADTMRDREIDDVDILLKQVEAGTKSYKLCKERLDLAEKKLNDILANADMKKSDDTSKDNVSEKKIDLENLSDDIPF